MKHLLPLLIFALLMNSCSHLQSSTETQQVLPNENVQLLNELERIKTASGDHAWPGYSAAKIQMVLASDHSQWTFGIAQPPAEYQLEIIMPDLDSALTPVYAASAYYDESGRKHDELPSTLFNAYSSLQTDSHFKQSVYFVKTLKNYRAAGDLMDAEEWVHISLHELFHTYQDQFIKYDHDFMKSVTVPYKQIIREDKEHIQRLQPELNHLAQAACSSDAHQARAEISSTLRLRTQRWNWVFAKYKVRPDNWERYEVWAEGTAHYVEHKIMADWRTYSDNSLIENDPYFRQFAKFKAENQKLWCSRISENRKRSYWYSIGFAYALVLDHLMPDWKSRSVDNRLFFDSNFRQLGLLAH